MKWLLPIIAAIQVLVVMLVVAVAIFFASSVLAGPEMEYNDSGTHFRLYNPDDRAYYCWIKLGDGSEFEKIIYPGMYTRWYNLRGGYSFDCSS